MSIDKQDRSSNTTQINVDDKSLNLDMTYGTMGLPGINIKPLMAEGYFSYDPGFATTALCKSNTTYIDGTNGILLHRGYPIEQLACNCNYMELCHLLIDGHLPNQTEYDNFVQEIKKHSHLHDQINSFFNGFRRDAHPMAIMVGVVGALSAFYHTNFDINNPEDRRYAAILLISKMPVIAAMSYKYSKGEPFIFPNNNLDYATNFLHMMFDTPYEDTAISDVMAKAMDQIFILHADHEQNASTTTVRTAGSTGANPFACISAGIGALWGPAHGGANEACLRMLMEIGDESKISEYIERAKDPNDSFRLMGFGHRVYKNYDPRAKVMREICHEVLETIDASKNPIFKLAMKLEKIALEDEYFIKKKLYPNVDFYSGITLSAMGISTNMFTVIFALARTVGWTTNWLEMMNDPERRLVRPRQIYTGPTARDVESIEQR